MSVPDNPKAFQSILKDLPSKFGDCAPLVAGFLGTLWLGNPPTPAEQARRSYDAYIEQGFTEAQAMELVKAETARSEVKVMNLPHYF